LLKRCEEAAVGDLEGFQSLPSASAGPPVIENQYDIDALMRPDSWVPVQEAVRDCVLILLAVVGALAMDGKSPEGFLKYVFNVSSAVLLAPEFINSSTIQLVYLISICVFFVVLGVHFLVMDCRDAKEGIGHPRPVSIFLLYQVMVPILSLILSCNTAYYFYRLTIDLLTVKELLICGLALVLCIWLIVSMSEGYYSRCKSPGFENFVMIFPMMHGALPVFMRLLTTHEGIRPVARCFLAIIVSIIGLIWVISQKPFMNPKSNRRMAFMFLISAPLSGLWMIHDGFSEFSLIYVISVCVFIGISWFIAKSAEGAWQDPLEFVTEMREERSVDTFPMEDLDSDTPLPSGISRWISWEQQDRFLFIWILCTLGLMTLVNALASRNMPLFDRLPDRTHDRFAVASQIRQSPWFGTFQISNIICMGLGLLAFIVLVLFPYKVNVRRVLAIYGTLCVLRPISFYVTSLPAPCAGLANCPCADPEVIWALRNANPLVMAFGYMFGLGIFLRYPECGDLIISGHMMFMWLIMKFLHSGLKNGLRPSVATFVNLLISETVMIAAVYIIISRNHYSVDVVLAIILTEILWTAYCSAQSSARRPASRGDFWLVKVVRWIETRQYPLQVRPGTS
jgi:hypothetical protein